MTTQPWTIERSASLREAHRVMRDFNIRHLPVLDRGRLVGLLSDRDLCLLEAVASVDQNATHVDEAMAEPPFVVTGDAAVDDVVEIMSEHKYGSVIVMGDNGVEGIFTAVDACRVLADVLRRAVG